MPTDFPKKGDNKKIVLRNSNYSQFDYDFALNIRENHRKVWAKGGNIRGNSAFTNWGKARKGNYTEAVKNWVKEREAWAARHLKDFRIAGVVAQMKWGVIGSKGEKYMKDLIKEEIEKQSKNMIELTFNTDVNQYSANGLINSLQENKGKSINLTVSSFGGSMASGLDVYYEIMKHGKVSITYRSMSASAATILAMGAKKRKIYENSLILIHKALSPVTFWEWANADDIDSIIEDLQKLKTNHTAFDSVIASIYYSKMKSKGYSKDDILELMSEDRWLTSNEALRLGLVDEIIEEIEPDQNSDFEEMSMVANFYKLPTLPSNNKDIKVVAKTKTMNFIDKIKNFFNTDLGLSVEQAEKANKFLTESFNTDIQNSIDERFMKIEAKENEKIEALQITLSDLQNKIETLEAKEIEIDLSNHITVDQLSKIVTSEKLTELENKVNKLGEQKLKNTTLKDKNNKSNPMENDATLTALGRINKSLLA